LAIPRAGLKQTPQAGWNPEDFWKVLCLMDMPVGDMLVERFENLGVALSNQNGNSTMSAIFAAVKARQGALCLTFPHYQIVWAPTSIFGKWMCLTH